MARRKLDIDGIAVDMPDSGCNLAEVVKQNAPGTKQTLIVNNDGTSMMMPISKLRDVNPESISRINTHQDDITVG